MLKRILSICLCFALCAALFPTSALADPAPAEDIAYISKFEITSIKDGSGNWDTDDKVSGFYDPVTGGKQTSTSQGNDASDSNRIVRTFDTIKYDFEYFTSSFDGVSTLDSTFLYYRFILPYPKEQAEWLTDSMGWIQSDGFTVTEETIDGKTCQVLSGRRLLKATTENPAAVPGYGTLDAHVKVLNMKNGDTVQPEFSVWLDGNYTQGICSEHSINEVVTKTADAVTVTASPKYNVRLKQGATAQHSVKGKFDFNTGNAAKALDYGVGEVEGRLTGIGVTLQLYNDYPDKKMMGIELPQGPITVDIDLKTIFVPQGGSPRDGEQIDVTDSYKPYVWGAGANKSGSVDYGGRDLKACGNNANYLYNGAPINNRPAGTPTYLSYCNDGGTWSATKTGNKVTLTISDYKIDMDYFPTVDSNTADSNNTFYVRSEGVKNIGCFSSGFLYVLTPFYNQNTSEYVLDEFETSSGTFYLDVKDVNMTASGVSTKVKDAADNSNQMEKDDDTVHATVALYMQGNLQNYIYYSSDANSYSNIDINGNDDYVREGKDYAVEGQKFSVHWQTLNDENGDEDNRGYSYKALLKFDPDGIELDGDGSPSWAYSKTAADLGLKVTYLYATKFDGTSWKDDNEMQSANIEDLSYYSSLDEIPEGHVCLGVIYEMDALGDVKDVVKNGSGSAGYHHVFFRAKQGSSRDETYMICMEGRVWRLRDYATCGIIESLAGKNKNTISLPAPSGEKKWNYQKATYVNGVYTSGHSGGFNAGDSLLIVKYRAGISKMVEQTNSGGASKQMYDMDYNQRIVDYVVYPRLYSGLPKPLSGVSSNVVSIEDTLPASLTYIEGSAYQGGSYVADADPSMHGSISGGTSMEPVITTASDGSQILTWTLYDVEVDSSIEPIHYSAEIGTPGDDDTDVKNGDSIENVVVIRAEGDDSFPAEKNGNLSRAVIQVSKLKAASLSKTPVSSVVDITDSLSYNLKASNNGNNATSMLLLDTLPYNGDALGSSFSGEIRIGGLSISSESFKSKNSWSVYYTDSEAIRSVSADQITASDVAAGASVIDGKTIEWTKLDYNTSTGVVSGFDPSGTPAALVLTGNLEPSETIKAVLDLSDTDKQPGDVFYNSLSSDKSSVSARETVISRSLEGVVWNDEDRNGERNTGEALYDGVTVTLLRNVGTSYEPVLDNSGKPVTCTIGKVRNAITGEETPGETGHFRFFGLEAGSYGVRIESGSYDISGCKVSEYRAAGVKEQVNNDAAGSYDPSGKLEYADIIGIDMPTKAELVKLRQSQFVSYNNDCGISADKYTLTYHVTGDEKYGVPTDSITPAAVTDIPWDGSQTLAPGPGTRWTTSDGTPDGMPGQWVFSEHWTENASEPDSADITEDRIDAIKEDKDVYGKWTFIPKTYSLEYHIAGDDTYGVPSDSVTPSAVSGIEWKNSVDPLADKPVTAWTTSDGTPDGVPGRWVFSEHWTENASNPGAADITGNAVNDITEDKDVYGKWTFIPDTYKVEYVVNSDPQWGVPGDSSVPVDTKEYDYKEDVVVHADLTTARGYAQDPSGGSSIVLGTWVFDPWDKDDFQITEDTTITGSWKFYPDPDPNGDPSPTPETYKVVYVVKPDSTWGKPSDSVTPTDPVDYHYLDKVTVEDGLSSTQDYAFDENGDKVPGTWSFVPWDKDDFKIVRNTTITGAWEFTPDGGMGGPGDMYKVTYYVEPDSTWGSPDSPSAPVDPTEYGYMEDVDVADDLSSTQDYAFDENGDKVPGTWSFVSWDKGDFKITEDTVIHGAWVFTPGGMGGPGTDPLAPADPGSTDPGSPAGGPGSSDDDEAGDVDDTDPFMPRTGDSSNPALWLMLMIFSAIVFACGVVRIKREDY